MNKITINGMTVVTNGRNITITNGHVFVDGKDVTPDAKEIHLYVEGDVGPIDVDACTQITVTGSVRGDVTTHSGNVQCGDVGASVETMSGYVRCGQVTGKVKTMSGDIRHG